MDLAKIRTLAQQIIDETNSGVDTPPPSTTINVKAGASLQSVIDQAAAGSTLILEDGTYDGVLKVSKPLTFQPLSFPTPRRASAQTPVWITGSGTETVTVDGANVKFIGIGIKNTNADGDLVNIVGSGTTLDRVTGVGDPVKGLHRGFRVHGNTTVITKCYMDDIFAIGRDTCCIGGWDGGNNILISDCYLRGGAETIMFGGADSASADRIPQNISVLNCTLTKNPDWFAKGIQIKNAFELKSAISVHVADCILEYAGIAQGQGAYPIVLTVRNQDGKAPWSTVKNVLIERCLVRFGGGGVNILGKDDVNPSDIMANVTLRNIRFTNIDPTGITKGSGRVVVFDGNPQSVTMDGITVDDTPSGTPLAALGYFPAAGRQPVGLTLSNWKFPKTTYGWKIDNGGMDVPPVSKNLKAYMPDLTYNITTNDAGAVGYPVV
jgi:hypothetical protein